MLTDDLLNPENRMTHVILAKGPDEKHISFPTPPNFQAYLKQVRTLEPDRRWEIVEAWDR
jgi:hypothetical protein